MPTMALVWWAQQAQRTASRHHVTLSGLLSRPEIRALMQFRVRMLMRSKSPCNTQGWKEQCGAGSCGGERPTVYDLLKCSELFPLPSPRAMCVTAPAYSCPAASLCWTRGLWLVAFGIHFARRDRRCWCEHHELQINSMRCLQCMLHQPTLINKRRALLSWTLFNAATLVLTGILLQKTHRVFPRNICFACFHDGPAAT